MKRHFFGVFQILGLLFLSGCTMKAHHLNVEAQSIQLVEYIKPELRAKLVEVDMVTCELGMNAVMLSANVEACENKLRNDAAAIGGNLVFVNPQDQRIGKPDPNSTDAWFVSKSDRTNHVYLRGIVYRFKSEAD